MRFYLIYIRLMMINIVTGVSESSRHVGWVQGSYDPSGVTGTA